MSAQHPTTFIGAVCTALIVPTLLAGCATASADGSGTIPASASTTPASTRPASTSGTASAAQSTLSFTSPLYGYTVSYPSDWTVKPATTRWGGTRGPGDPGVSDEFQSPGLPLIRIASQSLPKGWSQARWYADAVPAGGGEMPACFPPRSQWEPESIGGHQGGLFGGIPGCSFTTAMTIVDGRAYAITGMTDPSTVNQGVFDADLLHGVFDSMRFPGA